MCSVLDYCDWHLHVNLHVTYILIYKCIQISVIPILEGTMPPIKPMVIPKVPTLENPHSAYVAMASDRTYK